MPKSGQPQIPARLHAYEAQIPNFAPIFQWLRKRARLSWKEIGAAFQISDARVRQISSRDQRKSRSRAGAPPVDLSHIESAEIQLVCRPLIVIPSAEIRAELGIAPEVYESELPAQELADLAHLVEQIEREVAEYVRLSKIEDGLARMRWHIRNLGQPHSTDRIRLLSRLRHHSAWFLIHTGRTRSAIDQAVRAMLLSAAALHDSRQSRDGESMADSGLILSMAYAMRNQPDRSYGVLKMVRQIYDGIGTRPGSEYHRQVGTALLLMGDDQQAELAFHRAAAAMRRVDAAKEMIALLAYRQVHLLCRPNWDGALETVQTAKAIYAPHEMAYQTSMHWAAAVGLASGESKLTEHALEFLGPAPPVFFGHQATIRKLLEVTPRLPLIGKVLKLWTRFMMYANAFQDD